MTLSPAALVARSLAALPAGRVAVLRVGPEGLSPDARLVEGSLSAGPFRAFVARADLSALVDAAASAGLALRVARS